MLPLMLAATVIMLQPPIRTLPASRQPPSGTALANAYPERAILDDVAGEATLDCLVQPNGVLEGCRIVRETPAGYGFGEAALTLVPEMRMRPWTVDGAPYADRAEVTVPFAVPPSHLRWLDAAFVCYGWRAAASEAFGNAESRDSAAALLSRLAPAAAKAGYGSSEVEARLTASRLAADAARKRYRDAEGREACKVAEGQAGR